jgi:hypothetical protein
MPAPLDWLNPLPIRHSSGQFLLAHDPTPIQETFQQITDEAHRPHIRIPRRSPEIRRALCLMLRHQHKPNQQGRGPWQPLDPCYAPFRTIINPLLAQPIWTTARVIAAPFITYIPRARIGGIIDVILQFPDGSTAIAILQNTRRSEDILPVVRSELGGAIAAICDHRTVIPDHAITVWAAADTTEIEYHHPDRCLGLWVDALDRARFARQLQALG